MSLDLYVFNLINGLAGKWMVLDFLGIFFAKYFEYFLLFVLVLFLIKDYRKYWRMVAEALIAAVFVRFVLVEVIRKIRFRPRPFVYDSFNLLIPYDLSKTSFPSDHASFYFALSTIIYGYNKKAGMLFYFGSFFIAVSRVFAGVHWPSDILAGAILGIFVGIILNKVFKKIHPLKYVEALKK